MSGLNTYFNYQSARANRQTAHTLRQVQRAGREHELRERGWVRPSSTPRAIAAAESALAAQMNARVDIERGTINRPKQDVFGLAAVLGVIGALGALMFAAGLWSVAAHDGEWPLARGGAAIAVLSGGIAWLVYRSGVRREARRAEVVRRASTSVTAGCGWCGIDGPHQLEGELTSPRVYHAWEIDRFLNSGPR